MDVKINISCVGPEWFTYLLRTPLYVIQEFIFQDNKKPLGVDFREGKYDMPPSNILNTEYIQHEIHVHVKITTEPAFSI